MSEFIKFLIQKLVNKPDDVVVSEKQKNKVTVYELKVNKEDLGRVIGKNGKIITAVRTVLNAMSAKEGTRVMLEVLD